MLAALWVTTACNMRCKYCYEGSEKPNKVMSIEVANRSIKYIMNHFKKLNDDKLIIDFHGGEPLLQFGLIKHVTEKFKEIFCNSDKKLMFGITTNGLLLDDDIGEYLIDNFDYSLSFSIDGNKVTHDKNRILINGTGSYDLIIDKFIRMARKKYDIRARMTFTSETVSKLYENIKHLVDIGFNVIVPIPDYFDDKWDKHHMDILYKETEKTFQMFKKEKAKNNNLTISLVDDKVFKKGNCTGGITSLHIDPYGDIYPCSYVVQNNEFKLGNVNVGIDEVKLKKINFIANTENEICRGCSHYNCCYTTRCKLVNKVLTGNFNVPSPVICAIENIKCKFIKNNCNVLQKS